MATITTAASGTADVVLDTPMTLSTQTTQGVYTFYLNTTQMVNADVIRVQILTKTLSGSTEEILFDNYFGHVQGQKQKVWPGLVIKHSIKVILEQTDGTARDFEWALERL